MDVPSTVVERGASTVMDSTAASSSIQAEPE